MKLCWQIHQEQWIEYWGGNTMLKVGLIGCGGMGTNHSACYSALNETVKVVAVADVRREKAEEIAKKFGAEIYLSGKELINNADVDFVDICLPTYLHTEHAVMAMEKGLNVFIEKPICLNLEEAKLLLETEKKTGAKVQVGHVIRFWAEYVWLKKVAESKKYGNIISAVFTRLSPNPKWSWENWFNDEKKSGTMALDLHVHDVDFIRYLMGEPDSIQASATRDAKGVIQQIFTTYKYGDVVITAEGCWDYPDNFPFSMGYRVKFEKATAIFNSKSQPLVVYLENGEKIEPEIQKEFEQESDMGLNISELGAYYDELKYYTDRLISGEPLEIAPLSEAVKSAELVFKEIELVGGVKK